MKIRQIIKILAEEIKEKNRQDVIESYEAIISENFQELSYCENFFKLPLKNIFSVINKIDFNEIDEDDQIIETIQEFIKNTIKFHFEEKETLLILQNINTKRITLTYENIFSLLDLITNCPILVDFCNLYKEKKSLPKKRL